MAQVLADAFLVGQVAFAFPIQFCDVPVTVHSHSKECSKQFPREGYRCSNCEVKVLLAAKSYARGRFAISIYTLDTECMHF